MQFFKNYASNNQQRATKARCSEAEIPLKAGQPATRTLWTFLNTAPNKLPMD
jgi:hypothetical protein